MTTQFASASYQEVVDLHTESDTVSVIGIHTPQGDTPRKMFGGFFEQFKKFKYLGCSIKLVPAARLPADPLQVSYDAGEPTIDPRDMLNPLMFHGCHGNDMGVILNRLYALNSGDMNSDSINFIQDDTKWTLAGIAAGEIPNFQLEDLYYKALTDNTWKKAHPQRGFRKSGLRPLVYKMATNLQMLGSGSSLAGEVGVDGIPMDPTLDSGSLVLPVTQSGRQFFTPGLTGLGWLDTRNVLTDYKPVDISLPIPEEDIPDLENAIRSATLAQQNASESSLPLVYMGMILLPPAYKTEQYFRMVINHHFAFKDFRGISFSNNLVSSPAYNNFNDEDFQQGGDEVDPDDPSGGDDSGGGTSGSIILSNQFTKKSGQDWSYYTSQGINTLPIFQHIELEDGTGIDAGQNLTVSSGVVRSAAVTGFGIVDGKIRLVVYIGSLNASNQINDPAYAYLSAANTWTSLNGGSGGSSQWYPGANYPDIDSTMYARFAAGIDATGVTTVTDSWS